MDDNKLLRYSRHILLEPFGLEAQSQLDGATALVVGAGGLGAAALLYLASAGIGRIIIADGDKVDLTNLQRQVIHRESTIGLNKAMSAKEALSQINSTITIEAVASRLDEAALHRLVSTADIVLDCTDNFATRHAINRVCFKHKKRLVSGAAIRFDGQLTSFDFRSADAPCYSCLFPEDDEMTEERCAVMGVFAPLVGVIGTMQAAEAIHLLTNIDQSRLGKDGKLSMFDAITMSWSEVRYRKDPACSVCGQGHQVQRQITEVEHA